MLFALAAMAATAWMVPGGPLGGSPASPQVWAGSPAVPEPPAMTSATPAPTPEATGTPAVPAATSSVPTPAPPTRTSAGPRTISLVGRASAITDPGDLLIHWHQVSEPLRGGDLIIATIEVYDAEPFSVPSGFTLVASASNGIAYQPKTVMFRRWATPGETSVPVSFEIYKGKSSSVAVYRGVDRSSPIVGVSTSVNDGDPAITVGSVSADEGGRLVLVVGACSNNVGSPWTGTPSGMTRRAAVESEAWRGMVIYDQTVQAGTTGSRTASRKLPTHQSAVLVSLRVARA
jgi:hypothetical protein